MKTKILLNSLLVIVFFFSSCSSTKVVSDFDEAYNYNEISTYKIVYNSPKIASNGELNELNRKRLEKHINSQLALRGLSIDNENPDVIISYDTVLKEEKSISSNGSISSTGGYGRRYGGGFATGQKTASIESNLDATLSIYMNTNDKGDLLWYSSANKDLGSSVNPKDADKKLYKAVEKLMEEFPIQKEAVASK